MHAEHNTHMNTIYHHCKGGGCWEKAGIPSNDIHEYVWLRDNWRDVWGVLNYSKSHVVIKRDQYGDQSLISILIVNVIKLQLILLQHDDNLHFTSLNCTKVVILSNTVWVIWLFSSGRFFNHIISKL